MNKRKLFKSKENGVYTFPFLRDNIGKLRQDAVLLGFKLYPLNALFIPDRKDLFQALFEVGEFPDYFEFNWDSLEACLMDYSFAPAKGYIFCILHNSCLEAVLGTDHTVLIDIFNDACEHWQKKGVIFKLLVDT